MAEQYPLGYQRVMYRAGKFKEDLTVTVDMLNPNMVESNGIVLDELGKGLYNFFYNFSVTGVYVGLFYENGVRIASHSFLALSGLLGPENGSSSGGSSIHIPRR